LSDAQAFALIAAVLVHRHVPAGVACLMAACYFALSGPSVWQAL